MKVTVDINEKDLKEIMRYSGEKKKGPAITRFLASGLMLRRRREFSDQVLSGKIRMGFPHHEELIEKDAQDPRNA